MIRVLPSRLKTYGALIAAFTLASCGPLISFGEEGPPDDIYTLRYEGEIRHKSPNGAIIYVDQPQMVDGLDSQTIAVRLDGNRNTVLAGAAWSTHLSDLIRDYVTRALSASSDANLVSQGGLDIKAGCRLGIKVWAMELVPGQLSNDDKVEISLQFSMVRLSDSKLLSHPTFSRSAPVSGSDGRQVVAAFSDAMHAASTEYGRWFNEVSAACKTP